MKSYIKIDPKDNVLIALKDLPVGTVLDDGDTKITLLEDIKAGHKVSSSDVKKGENIVKYGHPIGHATVDIKKGENVHSHNLKTNLSGPLKYKYMPKFGSIKEKSGPTTFKGYKRANGDIGIRNELWIVPTVGCVNGVADRIVQKFKEEIDYSDIDGVQVFKHQYGCSQLGDDHENTRTILADITKHPNAGGVLVLGLGCENNRIDEFKTHLGDYDEDRTKFLVAQKVSDEEKEGLSILKDLYSKMRSDNREELPISELKIGLKCGGSDGFSGICANPLLGEFSDYLIASGGTTVLTEVPEMFGAETILMNRSETESVFEDMVDLINNFKEYFVSHDQPIYENPSPGNKEGGITTLEEKSLGCIQKGGRSVIKDVLDYGEIVKKKGLNLLNAPGNDLVASTALGAAGCHMILFTTGRGTPFGSFVPTMKVSTNSYIYNLKPHWIDFNSGELLEGKAMDELLDEFIEYVLDVASGEYVNHENSGFREIAIFKTGVTL